MAENSKIEWTDHTVNFWWGCAKVSPACANCYAEGQAARFFPGHWGLDAPRRIRVDAAAKEAMRFERQAVAQGRRFRVFTNSMADFFEDRIDLDAVRLEALEVIRDTPHLDWLILTKRPGTILDLLARAQKLAQGCDSVFPGDDTAMTEWLGWWLCGKAPANVWLGATVEDQEHIQRASDLQLVPAAVRFLSMEPLLGPVDLWPRLMPSMIHGEHVAPLDWIICGGESGPHARPMNPEWAQGLRDQCAVEGVPFLFKQWGEWLPDNQNPLIPGPSGATQACKVGKARAGRLLDGVEHNGYPTAQAEA